VTPHLFRPTAERPLRAKQQHLASRTHVVPHRHAWGQLALASGGVLRLTADHGTYLVPPSRAVWIPPAVEHAVTAVEDATLLTLYLHQPDGQCGPGVGLADQADWRRCRVLAVSDLLRALVQQLEQTPDGQQPPPSPADAQREALITALVLDELRRAEPLRLGLPLPADKRLRQLCEAVIDQPARHATLDGWARDAGASARTLARLFRSELGTSFGQWRQQALLAQALARAARGQPVALIAAELGYASASAFSAMVRRTVGQPPSRFFGLPASALA
jgi:AraC-like DNA-binding protein